MGMRAARWLFWVRGGFAVGSRWVRGGTIGANALSLLLDLGGFARQKYIFFGNLGRRFQFALVCFIRLQYAWANDG
jgi:hypothetical protein